MCPLHGTCQYTNPVKTSYAYTHKYIAPNFGIAYNQRSRIGLAIPYQR